jgi:hypothetical protein
MDFSIFDSVAAGNNGAWLHLNSPINGEPIWADDEKTKPCRVKVLGIEGDVGQSIIDRQRKAMKEGKLEADFEASVKETAVLVTDFENINRGDRPASAPDDVEWFFRLQRVVGGDKPSFLEQVRNFSLKRANQMGNVSGG